MGECPCRKVADHKTFLNAIMCVQLGYFVQDCLLSHQWGSSEIPQGDTVRARKAEAGKVLVLEGRGCLRKQHSKAPSLEHSFHTEIKILSLVEYVIKDVVQQADCMWVSDTQGNTLVL